MAVMSCFSAHQAIILPNEESVRIAGQHKMFLLNEVFFPPFNLHCSLAWGGMFDAAPHEPYKLVLTYPHGIKVVTDLDALRGKVTIRTPEDAIRFVRLRTWPATCKNFGINVPVWCEIFDSSDLPKDFDLGMLSASDFKMQVDGGRYGITSHRSYTVLRAKAANVAKVADGFEITREIVEFEPRTDILGNQKHKLAIIKEFAGEKGEYKVLSFREFFAPKDCVIHWYL